MNLLKYEFKITAPSVLAICLPLPPTSYVYSVLLLYPQAEDNQNLFYYFCINDKNYLPWEIVGVEISMRKLAHEGPKSKFILLWG